MAARDGVPAPEPVERFDPTSGYIVGYATIVATAALVVYLAVTDQTVAGLRVALGAVFLAVLVWATQIRPRAVAYADTLVLKNIVGDTEIPLALVEGVVVGTTLVVYTGEERYVCVGIGKSRKRRRARPGSLLGPQPEQPGREKEHLAAQAAESYVPSRIQELAAQARERGAEPGEVVRRTSLPVVAVIAVSGLVFVASLFL